MNTALRWLLGVLWVAGCSCQPVWKVLPDTDWPSHAPGAPDGFKAPNASTCADECLKIQTCVAISWNVCGPDQSETGDCWCK